MKQDIIDNKQNASHQKPEPQVIESAISSEDNTISRDMIVPIIVLVLLAATLGLRLLKENKDKNNPYFIDHAFFGFRLGEVINSKHYKFHLPHGYQLPKRSSSPSLGPNSMFKITNTPFDYIREINLFTYKHKVYSIIVNLHESQNINSTSIAGAILEKHKIISEKDTTEGAKVFLLNINGKEVLVSIIDTQASSSKTYPFYGSGLTVVLFHEELHKEKERSESKKIQRQQEQKQKQKRVESFLDRSF